MIDSGSLRRLFGGALFSGILLLSAVAAAQTTVPVYTLDDIAEGVARDINEAGNLAGWASIGQSVLPGVYSDATGVMALPLLPVQLRYRDQRGRPGGGTRDVGGRQLRANHPLHRWDGTGDSRRHR